MQYSTVYLMKRCTVIICNVIVHILYLCLIIHYCTGIMVQYTTSTTNPLNKKNTMSIFFYELGGGATFL